ncbi:MAG: enoyl-CoA hydratase/isomerase family protein [Phaeodactylibacter sp.]|nr:enoyl-CoA hydratase/isomerase family protein [Phaeodactylibacter sp.]MCB9275553.1 enoyl-CoA hydratase/isomerase family protein [Lewinellaceae bacterium]
MQENIQSGSVDIDIKAGIATITFYHPAHNALPGPVLSQLEGAIRVAGDDNSVKVVILQSAGERAFCAGASFDELVSIEDANNGKHFFMGFANVINAMRKCPKFIIVRVQGKAVGGGVGLCAAADYCIATKWASIKLSELAIGIGPFVVGPAIERKMGASAMTHLAINATEWKTAHWAQEKGLFNEVFDSIEQLDAYVAHLSQQLSGFNPEAMRELKRAFWEGTEHWDALLEARAAISGSLVLSSYTKQAIERFKHKAE